LKFHFLICFDHYKVKASGYSKTDSVLLILTITDF
jgi:hypothetical protein